MVKVGINGFGIMGRGLFRAINNDVRKSLLGESEVEIMAINDIFPVEQLAPLLRHDSIYGNFGGSVEADNENLVVNGKKIAYSMEREPSKLRWGERGVDVVYESSGVFASKPGVEGHLSAGAKKVVISSPSDFAKKTIVMGVNDKEYNGENIISNASCTTNCLAPLALALYDSFGPYEGLMTTVHAYTQDQRLQDSPHKDIARAYAAGLNIVPTFTGAAKAIGEVIPKLKSELDGKVRLDGIAVRVPVAVGSLVDLVVNFDKADFSREHVNNVLRLVSDGYLKGAFKYEDGPLVSSMILGERTPSVVDGSQTRVIGKTLKVMSWYDNVMGYSYQAVRLIRKLGERL